MEVGRAEPGDRRAAGPDHLEVLTNRRDVARAHVVEPKLPGAVERYVNLGACYDRAGLQAVRAELTACMKGYKGCYQRAYRCLTAAAQIGEDMRAALITPAVEARLAKRTKRHPGP